MVTRAHIVEIQVSWTFYELNITSDAYCLTVLEQRERPEFHLSHRSRGHGYMPSKEPWPSGGYQKRFHHRLPHRWV